MSMKERILELLAQIEREQNVRILYAAESGSRAWGFASKDSDYDVRFIYIRPIRDYLSVEPKTDVMDKVHKLGHICDDLMDFSGWDIMKAMKLFQASNPAMMEWLDSPVCYVDGEFADKLRGLRSYISLTKLSYHYHSLAKGNFERYLKNREKVTYKKYLYVLRSLFCCFWIEQFKTAPPTDFSVVLNKITAPTWVIVELRRIIAAKAELDEADVQDPHVELNGYIDAHLNRLIPLLKHNESELIDSTLLDNIIFEELSI